MASQAKTLWDSLRDVFSKKAEETPTDAITPTGPDLRYLQKFSFSDELKGEFVKVAETLDVSRRDIYDAFNVMDKNLAIRKQADYIQWLSQISSS